MAFRSCAGVILLSCLVGISLKDRISNKVIWQKTKFIDIVHRISKLKWQWAGNTSCRTDNRWGERLLEWRTHLVLASSAVPKQKGRKPVNQPARSIADSERDAEITSDCPEDGFFADAEQCDKYYQCRNGEIIEKLCPDGMVFNDYSNQEEKCDLPFNLDCSQRPKLQTPIPSLHCVRQNGYFSHEDPKECGKFYYCVDGKFNMITCPDGLVYNDKTGICTWADEAKKKGCGAADVFAFDCPPVNETFGLTHPRYADPEDCQFFYVCINGNTPRRSGCKLGQVFDDVQKRCEWARKVPECADWYKGQLTDAELEALENPPTPKHKPSGSGPSRRKPQRPSKGKSVEPVEE